MNQAPPTGSSDPTPEQLIERSHRLGADRRNTNYAGGNTSAKGMLTDPVTSHDVEVMWVKGSGGDLGTLTEAGLSILNLDRMRSLVDVYPGEAREDEMVAALSFCLHGPGGAAPSIDTAMHGLVAAAHVDHLHPDSGIALATSAAGPELTRECFGDTVVWVPWRRPGFQLGLDIAAIKESNPQAIGCILGGHGITAWGNTSDECERNSLHIIRTAEQFLRDRGQPDPFGAEVPARAPLDPDQRRAAQLRSELVDYMVDQVESRRNPGEGNAYADDAFGDIAAGIDAGMMKVSEIQGLALLLIAAGMETTTSLMGNMVHALATGTVTPEQLLGDNGQVSATAIDEFLRFDGPAQWLARVTTRPVELHGIELPVGSRVLMSFASANRDPREFDRADELVLDRDGARNLAFGEGIHFCLGMPLARLEARVGISTLIEKAPPFTLTAPPTRYPSHVIRGFESIPVAFGSAPTLTL